MTSKGKVTSCYFPKNGPNHVFIQDELNNLRVGEYSTDKTEIDKEANAKTEEPNLPDNNISNPYNVLAVYFYLPSPSTHLSVPGVSAFFRLAYPFLTAFPTPAVLVSICNLEYRLLQCILPSNHLAAY
jgi:hypothetical protein